MRQRGGGVRIWYIRAIWKYFSRYCCSLYFTRLRLVKYDGNKNNSKNISRHESGCSKKKTEIAERSEGIMFVREANELSSWGGGGGSGAQRRKMLRFFNIIY